jgi:hypothetical protein
MDPERWLIGEEGTSTIAILFKLIVEHAYPSMPHPTNHPLQSLGSSVNSDEFDLARSELTWAR